MPNFKTAAREVIMDEQLGKGRRGMTFYTKKFEDYRATFERSRAVRMKERRYYHGDQWSSSEKAELQDRKQPDAAHNATRRAINGTIGVIAQSETDPRAWARTPDDEGAADTATASLRYAADCSQFDHVKLKQFKQYCISGTAAIIIEVDEKKKIHCRHIRWEEFFIDPRSREEDCSDAEYMGIGKWMYASQLARKYPKWAKVIESCSDVSIGLDALFDESFDDRPNDHSIWIDKESKRVFVVEMYYRDGGTWYRCVFFAGGILEEGRSAYKDEHGHSINPIEAVSCYIDDENQRYGLIKDMMDIQDGINKRHSKLLHIASSAQVQAADPSAIEVDPDVVRAEAARPDGVLPYGWQKVQTTDMAQAQAMLLAKDEAEIERLAPNPAILGRQGSDSSNVALQTRQQAGLVELGLIMEQWNHFEWRCFRQMWFRMKQFWKAPMWVRVTKDPAAPEYVGINQPIKGQVPVMNEYNMESYDPETGEPLMEEGVVGYENVVAQMDMDIVIDTQPETATLMAELITKIMDLVARVPQYQQEVPFEFFIENLPIPRKTQTLKRLREGKQAAQANMEKQREQARAVEEAAAASEIRLKNSSAAEKEASAAVKGAEVPLRQAQTQLALSQASKTAIEAFLAKEETGAGSKREAVGAH